MAKTERLFIRIAPELKEKLQRAAEAENRTLSNYIESVLIKEIKREGLKMKKIVEKFVENEVWKNLIREGMEAILYKSGDSWTRQEGTKGVDEDEIIYRVSLSSDYWGDSYALDYKDGEWIKDESMKEDFIRDITEEILKSI